MSPSSSNSSHDINSRKFQPLEEVRSTVHRFAKLTTLVTQMN